MSSRDLTANSSDDMRRHVLSLLAEAKLVLPEAREADALADLRRREQDARVEPCDRQAMQIIASGRRLLGDEPGRSAMLVYADEA